MVWSVIYTADILYNVENLFLGCLIGSFRNPYFMLRKTIEAYLNYFYFLTFEK